MSAKVILLSFLIALWIGLLYRPSRVIFPVHKTSAPPSTESGHVFSSLRARDLIVLAPNSEVAVQMAAGAGGGPGLWLNPYRATPWAQFGLHAPGDPFVGVMDRSTQNMGLARVDGKYPSPILVFKTGNIVKMVLGLSMIEPGQNPFLVYWGSDDKMKVPFGSYCEVPDRHCTH